MKATGYYLGYMCWYIVWEVRRYWVIFSEGEWNVIFYCRLPLKKTARMSWSWTVWSSRPWRDNGYKQWWYSHLDLVIEWILYSQTLKILPVSDLRLAEDSVLINGKQSGRTFLLLRKKKRPLSISTWKREKCAIEYKQPIVCWKRIDRNKAGFL